MRPTTREALELVIEKARKLQSYSMASFLAKRGIALTETDGHFTIEPRGAPSEESVDAFILNLRFFIQSNERSSFGRLPEILDDPGLSDHWKKEFVRVRQRVNRYLDAPPGFVWFTSEPTPTRRVVLKTFLYGGLAHASGENRKRYIRWKGMRVFFPALQFLFDGIVFSLLGAISYIAELSEEELESQRSQAE